MSNAPVQDVRVITFGPWDSASEGLGDGMSPGSFDTWWTWDVMGDEYGNVYTRQGINRTTAGFGATGGHHANLGSNCIRFWDYAKANGDRYRMVLESGSGDLFYNSVAVTSGEPLTMNAVVSTLQLQTYSVTGSARNGYITGAVLNDLFLLTNPYVPGNVAYYPYTFNGTTWSAQTELGAAGGTGLYKAGCGVVEHDRFFVGNIYESSTKYSSRIRFSDAAAPTTWTDANYIDINPDDGQRVTALYAYQGSILIFKEHSVYVLTGRSTESFTIYNLTREFGTTNPESVQEINGVIYFVDVHRGIITFDGESFSELDVIQGAQNFLDTLYSNPDAKQTWFTAAAFDEWYVVSFGNGTTSGTVNRWAWWYNTKSQTWWPCDTGFMYGAKCPYDTSFQLVGYYGPVNTGPVYEMWPLDYWVDGTNDDGVGDEIVWQLGTGLQGLESGERFKILRVEFVLHAWGLGNNGVTKVNLMANQMEEQQNPAYVYAGQGGYGVWVMNAIDGMGAFNAQDEGYNNTQYMRSVGFTMEADTTSRPYYWGVRQIRVYVIPTGRQRWGSDSSLSTWTSYFEEA